MSEEKMLEEEIIKDYKKIAEENQQKFKEIQENKLPSIIPEKVKNIIVKTVKGILGGGMVVGTATSLSACKEMPAVVEKQQEEEKPTAEVSSKTTQETKEETKETQETLPETTTEIEKIKAPEIPGLKFNQETRKYFNEAGIEVGVYVEDAIEINGKMEDAVGLVREEIEDRQNEIFKETKERLLPILIDLTTVEDVKMQKLEVAGAEIDKEVWAFNVSVGTEFLAPLSGGWGMFKPFPNVEDKRFFTNWDIEVKGELGRCEIYFRDAEILAKMEEGISILNPKDGKRQDFMGTEVKLGDPLGKITSNTPLENFSKSGWGEYQVVTFLKNGDKPMEIGNGPNTCKVFIFNQ